MKFRRVRFGLKNGHGWASAPGITKRLCFGRKDAQAFQKVIPVFIIPEDLPALNPPDHHMMQ
jgi:hypothetical protein